MANKKNRQLGSASFGGKNSNERSSKTRSPKKTKRDKTLELASVEPQFPDCSLTADKIGNCAEYQHALTDGSMREDFICDRICGVYDLINAGKIDLSSARVGFTVSTNAIVWDKAKLLSLLLSYGYCYGCAMLFIDGLEDMPVDDDIPKNILIWSDFDSVCHSATLDFKDRHTEPK